MGCLFNRGEGHFSCFDILKTRLGRFRNNDYGLFPAKLLLTCNPTDGWLYREFYKPDKEGDLPQDHAFIKALYSDNPYTREEYGKQLDKIKDPKTRARLRDGDWEFASGDLSIMRLDAIIDLFTNPLAIGDQVKRLSGDLARFGGDKIVLGNWIGWDVYSIAEKAKQSLKVTKEDIRSILSREGIAYSNVVLDEEGLGGG